MGGLCSNSGTSSAANVTFPVSESKEPFIDPKPDIIPDPATLSLHEQIPLNPEFCLSVDCDNSNNKEKFLSGLSTFIESAKQFYADKIETDNESKESNGGSNKYGHIKNSVISIDIPNNDNNPKISGILTLGLVCQYILLNRSFAMKIALKPLFIGDDDDGNDGNDGRNCNISFGVEEMSSEYVSLAKVSKNDSKWKEILSSQGIESKHGLLCDYRKYETYIRMIHMHTHFNKNNHSTALGVFESLKAFLINNNCKIEDRQILYRKNGPHNVWNWQIYTRDDYTFGLSLIWLILNMSNSNDNCIYHPFHVRTYDNNEKINTPQMNEFFDHSVRLGWVGKSDPLPLDIDFFVKWHIKLLQLDNQ